MDCNNMDTHHSPEGHAGQDPITPEMDHSTQSDIALQEFTKSCTQDISKRYISPKKEQILSPKSAECTPLNNTSSSVSEPTTVSRIELFSDRHLVRNIIPNHHIHPFVKLEPLDSESWGNALSDGKRTQNQDHSATHERTEFGLLSMDLRKCDQKKVLLKMDKEGKNLDGSGKRCENDKADSTCDECATITCLDRETNKNCGKCGKIFSSQTNRQTQELYKCDQCGKMFSQFNELQKHLDIHTQNLNNSQGDTLSPELSNKDYKSRDSQRHQMEIHQKSNRCSICGRCYRQKSDLLLHMKNHDRPASVSQSRLQNHSKLHGKLYRCNICGRCLSDRKSLRNHTRCHNRSESSRKCEPCDKIFKTEYSLQKHTTKWHIAHSCDICGQSFQGKVWLNCHERAHQHENNSHDFYCYDCGEKYKTFDSFQTHLESHKDTDMPYRCDICGKTFCELLYLRKHLQNMNTHTDEDTLREFKFSCDVCGKKFKENDHFEKHKNFHTKNKQFSCDICSKSFIYKSTLKQHLKSHCQKVTTSKIQCEKCDEMFVTKKGLSIHQNNVHTMESCNVCGELIPKGKLNSHRATHEEKQKCDLCGKCYSGKSMKRHMQYHARSVLIKKFVCDLCGKKFSKQASLQNHSQLHEKLIKCNICGRYVSSWYSLKCHIETHNRTESSTKCESCDKTFKTEYFLQRHTTDLHVAHSCDICGQSFQGKVWLNFHERAHQHENNSHDFCCYECGESYKTFDSFQTHLEIHKDMDRPYRCDICGKTFCELRYLRSHLKDKNTHTDEDTLKEFKFSCDVCGRKFQQSLRFEKHMDFHRKNKQISCNICNRNFTNQSALDKHFESHSTLNAEHHCEKCDVVFQTEFILKKHLKRVHTTELCHICGEEVSKSKLKSHKAKHQEKHKCDLCGKFYYGFEGMRRHKQYHKRLLSIKKFSCEICSKQFYLHLGLIEHMKIHQKSIRCKICGHCFSYKGALRRHMIIHNRPASVGKCETCGKTFQSEHVLQRHIKCFHVKKSCKICGLKFKEKSEKHMEKHHTKQVCDTCGIEIDGKLLLECHKLTHVFEKGLFDFKCYVCGESFNTSDKLQRHIDNHIKNENGSSRFGCEICGKRYGSLLYLSTHVNTHRKDIGHYCKTCGRIFKEAEEEHKCPSKSIPKHMCEVCGRGFWSEFSLNKHKEEHDQVAIDFKCEQCDWKFVTEKNLQTHMDYVHKLVPCDICGQELTNKEMGLHKRTMHPEDYVCDICGHKFSGLSKLKIHLETHSLSTQDTKYLNCNICGKTLNTVLGLQRHQAIHKRAQKKKSLICEICGKGFSERKGLLNHTLTHKPKSLQCNKCGKKFVTRNTLLNHVKCRRECRCGKMFNDKRLFEQHIQLHDGDEELHGDVTSQFSHSDRKLTQRSHEKKITDCPNYKCKICKRKFKSEINMENHITRDHNKSIGNQFKCKMCFKMFMSKTAINAHIRMLHAKKCNNVRKTKNTAADLMKHTSTDKVQQKDQVSRSQSVESIDKESSIDNQKVQRPKGKRGHMRESKIPFLEPRVINEDSLLLSLKETMELPPEKYEEINDGRNFLNMVIRKSIDDLGVLSLKHGQYLTIVTKIKELVLNKNLDEGKINQELKKKVASYIKFKKKKNKGPK